MIVPPSEYYKTLDLSKAFNADRRDLPEELRLRLNDDWTWGPQSIQGIPFWFGLSNQPNIVHLNRAAVRIPVSGLEATYFIFIHAVADRAIPLPSDLADFSGKVPYCGTLVGDELGDLVSEYQLEYMDGAVHCVPIRRRFAIQQAHIDWGAAPFEAIPVTAPVVTSTAGELQALGRGSVPYAKGEVRHGAGIESAAEHLWLYALENPHPERPVNCIVCTPREEESVVYAISYTQVSEHPLRGRTRQKLKLTFPDELALNAIGELDGIALDLGTVISARGALEYDSARWNGSDPDRQPVRSERSVIVEYSAHPTAKLYLQVPLAAAVTEPDLIIHDLAKHKDGAILPIKPSTRLVHLRVTEKGSGEPVPVRLHVHGEAGEYLPPRGHQRKVNGYWLEDRHAEFVNGLNQYCYIPGDCEIDLPLGEVFIEITRGYEVAPLRTSFVVTPETDEVSFELDRVLHWRERGWVTADTHVHYLSPQTALLEGTAEGVNVVNLLASQWGEMFTNVGDFDGRTTFGAETFGGSGEFLVRVGTENRMQVLGHISLLGYSGAMIQPLCSGGPSESAMGDALEVTMADWAQRCIEQNGLVVMPHAPNPQCERAADIVLNLVHAIEMATFNPFNAQISPYGLTDWYRYLNLGYQIPIVGGSDKMSAASLLGGIRTYAHIGDSPLTYERWMAAIKSGNAFATVGPLVEMNVEGLAPGKRLELPPSGGTVAVEWRVESVSVPIERVEVVVSGMTAAEVDAGGTLSALGSIDLKITQSTWIAVRVRGSYHRKRGEVAAHTSAVQVIVGGQALFSNTDALAVLQQIEGALAYVDTIATRPEAQTYKKLRATLEGAYNRLHQQMHRQGVFHQHPPIQDHSEHHVL